MQKRVTCGNCGGINAYLVKEKIDKGNYTCQTCNHTFSRQKQTKRTTNSKSLRKDE